MAITWAQSETWSPERRYSLTFSADIGDFVWKCEIRDREPIHFITASLFAPIISCFITCAGIKNTNTFNRSALGVMASKSEEHEWSLCKDSLALLSGNLGNYTIRSHWTHCAALWYSCKWYTAHYVIGALWRYFANTAVSNLSARQTPTAIAKGRYKWPQTTKNH